MNRGLRRDITLRKYISRIKKRLYKILVLDGYRITRYGHKIYNRRKALNWEDANESCPWVKRLKHGKVYGRSNMNVLEKHFRVKNIRKETKKLIRNYEDF